MSSRATTHSAQAIKVDLIVVLKNKSARLQIEKKTKVQLEKDENFDRELTTQRIIKLMVINHVSPKQKQEKRDFFILIFEETLMLP